MDSQTYFFHAIDLGVDSKLSFTENEKHIKLRYFKKFAC